MVGFPSWSECPDKSTTWMSTSASNRSFKNLLPLPLPSYAPGTNPATSLSNTGTSLSPRALWPYSASHLWFQWKHGQGIAYNAWPMFGSIVVNGWAPILAVVWWVAALKNVDFPADGFPTKDRFCPLIFLYYFFNHRDEVRETYVPYSTIETSHPISYSHTDVSQITGTLFQEIYSTIPVLSWMRHEKNRACFVYFLLFFFLFSFL